MRTYIITIILLICCSKFAIAKEYHQHQHLMGAPANHEAFESTDVEIPPLEFSKTGKSLVTFNKFGFDLVTTERNWVIESFLQFCSNHKNKYVLDIGAGFGGLTREALKTGVRVISNDIDHRHLHVGRGEIKDKEQLSRLILNNKAFPTFNLPDNFLEAVMIHRVLHFLPGEKIDIGLAKIHKWLKPGGKVFIVVIAADHVAFSEYYKKFNHNKHAGDHWPGENISVAKTLPDQAYALPHLIHIMDQDILRRALTRHGFKVERSGFISMKHFGSEPNRNGKEAVGIVAVKN